MLIWEWVLGWISGEITIFDRVGYVIRPSNRRPKKAIVSRFNRAVLRSDNKRIILRAKH
jgi:hypothetical protein